MTLNTSIAIGKPYSVREVFDFCRKLLNTPDATPFFQEDSHSWGCKEIRNPGGIGLDAWLWIYYGADGPITHVHDEWCPTEVGPAKWDDDGEYIVTQEEIDNHAEWIATDPTKNGWAAIEVTFDTSYGHRNRRGERCDQLHTRLVAELGRWLDDRGLPWKWQNEYTGEWFDRYEGLAGLAGAHRSSGAEEWFQKQVLPLITGGDL